MLQRRQTQDFFRRGLGAGKLSHQPSVAHHQDAVGQQQGFGKLARGNKQRQAAGGLGAQDAVDLELDRKSVV